eukprot:TRINITY_DN7348_c0_g1_i3.p1 TRINITY_DN7348_c0_g1~~TRINITY_DN7348_c0_g1_i3.p1  ORF type:complete len:358 (-),score=59.48 TRINITY_DN7348_c0_g1_i3:117-1190(-)
MQQAHVKGEHAADHAQHIHHSPSVKVATVLGGGSWGTALAKHLASKGIEVRLWLRSEVHAQEIQTSRENAKYLKGFRLPDTLIATSDFEAALRNTEMIVSVVPSHGLRDMIPRAQELFPADVPIVSATKGIENDTLFTVSEIYEQLLPKSEHYRLVYLGGPSFAKEVASGLPTVVSVAGHDHRMLKIVQHSFNHDMFRVYHTEDVVGVELGGALKNVIAIAAGASDGLGFGHNARAALITRGLAEINRLAVKRGAHPLSISGLSGMGDLVLTCTGDLSRNRSVGLELGRGRALEDILNGMTMVAEGVKTTKAAYELAQREGIDMPITTEVYNVLYQGKNVRDAVRSLMTRPLMHERD